ncbi:MAG: SH3 domain-containing protein [Caldilineaceae bacterium]|nr:SH3 domain-containing protein [Caldilineaceae bacterium]
MPVLNVRNGPGTSYPVIGRVGRDAVVTILGRNADASWLNFCCLPNSQTQGWISALFVTPGYTAEQAAALPVIDVAAPVATATPTTRPVDSGARTGVVSAVALNMREAPSTDAAVLGKLRSGATVTVLARNDAGDWWLVCCVPGGEENAWVAAEFVTPNFTDAASLPVTTGRTAPAEAEAPAAATPEPTPTQASLEATTLEVAVVQDPAAALQGEQIMLAFTVTNTGSAEAAMVELSFELPAGLAFVSASADGGEVVQEDADSGAAIVVVTWESLPAGESAGAKVTVSIAEDVADGAVLDGAAAVVAENAELASVAVSVGLPPVDPPDFQ